MIACAAVLVVAFVLDVLVGDPRYMLHPVRLIGRLCTRIERILRRIRLDGYAGGFFLALFMIGIVCGVYLGLRWLFGSLHHFAAYALDGFVVMSCVAQRDLVRHAWAVSDRLGERNLQGARETVQQFVGRDAMQLDPPGVARAAVESVAEGFVDGILSPLLWYVLGGVVAWLEGWDPVVCSVTAMLMFKTVSTLDSMVGYRNEKYIRLGCASARLDDMMNYFPARLSLCVLSLSSVLCRAQTGPGLRIAFRDRRKHPSPNAGYAESFMAGALALRLGGPTVYAHGTVDKAWLGDGSAEADAGHISRACRLVACAGWISLVVCGVVLVLTGR